MPDNDPNAGSELNGGGTAVKLGRKDFQSDQEVRWCPGCGDYSILAAMQQQHRDRYLGRAPTALPGDSARPCRGLCGRR